LVVSVESDLHHEDIEMTTHGRSGAIWRGNLKHLDLDEIGGEVDRLIIGGHGNGHGVYGDGKGYSATEIAAALQSRGIKPRSIELIACGTGGGPFAQSLSDKMGSPVIATSGFVRVEGGLPLVEIGGTTLPYGQGWKTFYPQQWGIGDRIAFHLGW
jgi:hypothetical protein